MIMVSALCLALATYLAVTRHLLPERHPAGGRVMRRRPRKDPPWTVTDRARELLGWSRRRLLLTSWGAASALGLAWALLLQNPLVGLPMGWVGYQLPGLWLELRAARDLATLQRQVGLFVHTAHDHLHARGATVEDALMAATQAVGPGPLSSAMEQYRRHVDAGFSLADRLAALDRAVHWPSMSFFLSLLALRDETGTQSMAHAFDSLMEKLQDDERVQQMIRGELSLYLTILLLSFALDVFIFPYYRVASPQWPLFHRHLALVITATAFASAVVFQGVRKFARAQVIASD